MIQPKPAFVNPHATTDLEHLNIRNINNMSIAQLEQLGQQLDERLYGRWKERHPDLDYREYLLREIRKKSYRLAQD